MDDEEVFEERAASSSSCEWRIGECSDSIVVCCVLLSIRVREMVCVRIYKRKRSV